MPAITSLRVIAIALFTGFLGMASIFMSDILNNETDMRITPALDTVVLSEPFSIEIEVTSPIPVNVFKGELQFNHDVLKITGIDYNTSIADLWAERPWYSNGEGTLNFIGGTTKTGGFIGTGDLITVTFTPLTVGKTEIALREVRILAHDGFGTDTKVTTPIDSIFTVAPEEQAEETVIQKSSLGSTVTILTEPVNTDLNNDGKQSVADMSIFMQHLTTGNLRSDFNKDNKVNMADASILLNAK